MKQTDLDASCWRVQIMGLKACQNCEVRLTPDCGGSPEVKITLERLSDRLLDSLVEPSPL